MTNPPSDTGARLETGLDAFQGAVAALFSAAADADVEVEVEVSTDERVLPSPELLAVTHRIASQFLDIVASAAGQVLSGRGTQSLDSLNAALDSLERLAIAASDEPHLALITELRTAATAYATRLTAGRGHAAFRDALRDWLPRYAAHVGGSGGDRLRRLVEFDSDDVPLFRHLSQLPGIGTRRLRRLYSAGLHTAEVLERADTEEMALVTGLPRRLAGAVVEATARYQSERRERLVLELPHQLDEFARILADVKAKGDPALLRTTLQALQDVERIVQRLRSSHDVA